MDDIFIQLMGIMGGYIAERRGYLLNGREITPEEFEDSRKTGKLPGLTEQAAPAANAP